MSACSLRVRFVPVAASEPLGTRWPVLAQGHGHGPSSRANTNVEESHNFLPSTAKPSALPGPACLGPQAKASRNGHTRLSRALQKGPGQAALCSRPAL